VSWRMVCTINVPKVMLGTKRPSITSRWMRSAPPASAAATWSARCPKSAVRMEGANLTGLLSTIVLSAFVSLMLVQEFYHNLGNAPGLSKEEGMGLAGDEMQLGVGHGGGHPLGDGGREELVGRAVDDAGRHGKARERSERQINRRFGSQAAEAGQDHILVVPLVVIRVVKAGGGFHPVGRCFEVGGFKLPGVP